MSEDKPLKTWKTVKKKKRYLDSLLDVLRADGRKQCWVNKHDGNVTCGWVVPVVREVMSLGVLPQFPPRPWMQTTWDHFRYELPLELVRLHHDDPDKLRELLETEIAIKTVKNA